MDDLVSEPPNCPAPYSYNNRSAPPTPPRTREARRDKRISPHLDPRYYSAIVGSCTGISPAEAPFGAGHAAPRSWHPTGQAMAADDRIDRTSPPASSPGQSYPPSHRHARRPTTERGSKNATSF